MVFQSPAVPRSRLGPLDAWWRYWATTRASIDGASTRDAVSWMGQVWGKRRTTIFFKYILLLYHTLVFITIGSSWVVSWVLFSFKFSRFIPVKAPSHWGMERSWRRYHLHQVQMDVVEDILLVCVGWESHWAWKNKRWMYEYIYIDTYNDNIIYVSDNYHLCPRSILACFLWIFQKYEQQQQHFAVFFPNLRWIGCRASDGIVGCQLRLGCQFAWSLSCLGLPGTQTGGEIRLWGAERLGPWLVGGWDGNFLELVRWGGMESWGVGREFLQWLSEKSVLITSRQNSEEHLKR